MPGANWNVPTSLDPADPRNPLKRRDPKLARSEVEAKKARDKAEKAARTPAEEPKKSSK